jgi:hypothetical protein
MSSASVGVSDRGRDDRLGRPSLRTEQADYQHSALQLVVGLRRRSADASIDASGSSMGDSRYRGSRQARSRVEGSRTLVALHRIESIGHLRCCIPSSFVLCLHLPASLGSTGITPLLRYYGGSVTFRARFFGPAAGHERRSFPES